MKHLRAATLLATFALLVHGAALAQRKAPSRVVLPPSDEEVIVGFKPEAATLRKHALSARSDATTTAAALSNRAAALGLRMGHSLQAGAATGPYSQVVKATGMDAATLARQLAADPDVAYAVPNGRKRFFAAPNDPLYPAAAVRTGGPLSGQWYLRAPDSTIKSSIDIEPVWARTYGSASTVVAVLDTGFRFEHPDLGRAAEGGRLLPGYDFVSNTNVANDGDGRDSDPSDPGDWVTAADARTNTFSSCAVEDSSWHGTSTASLVAGAANNATGMAGGAPGVLVLPVRVLGKCYGTDSDIQAGMRWAAGIPVPGVPDNPTPAKVINMSLGGGGACSASYQAVVNEIVARGVTIVAAAGNSAGGPVSEPASCSGVIGVLALRHVGSKVGFSDLGPEIAISAPGGNCVNTAAGSACLYPILAARNTGTQGPLASAWSDSFNITVGTSFASPLVAAVAGLLATANPAITVAQMRTALQSTARPFPQTGADNGTDPTPVAACRAPSTGVEQLQCYCPNNGTLCGAGMVDAGRAFASVAGAIARIDVSTAAPTSGASVALSGAGSSTLAGASITGYAWSVIDGGGIVTAFTSATNASTAAITPSAGGAFKVQLSVTDSSGRSHSTQQLVAVAGPTGGGSGGGSSGGGGGGGGAASGAWVAGVALAAAVLLRLRASRRRP